MEENNNEVAVKPQPKYKFIALSEKTHTALKEYRKEFKGNRTERSYDVVIQTLLSKSATLDQELG